MRSRIYLASHSGKRDRVCVLQIFSVNKRLVKRKALYIANKKARKVIGNGHQCHLGRPIYAAFSSPVSFPRKYSSFIQSSPDAENTVFPTDGITPADQSQVPICTIEANTSGLDTKLEMLLVSISAVGF